MRVSKHEGKIKMARLNFEGIVKDIEKRSASGYNLKLKEVKETMAKKREKDRLDSLRHYEYLKHKLDEETNNSKKRNS
jgi:hypothetical protein